MGLETGSSPEFEVNKAPTLLLEELNKFLPKSPQRILEFGYNGDHFDYRYHNYLANLGHTIIGVGDDEARLVAAQQIAQVAGYQAQYLLGDINSLPAGFDEEVDVVISHYDLNQLERNSAYGAIQVLQRLTKPGGLHAMAVKVGPLIEATDRKNGCLFSARELRAIYSETNWLVKSYHSAEREVVGGELTRIAILIAENSLYQQGEVGRYAARGDLERVDPELAEHAIDEGYYPR